MYPKSLLAPEADLGVRGGVRMDTEEYSHTQMGWVILISVMAAIIGLLWVVSITREFSAPIFLTLIILVIALATFATLTVSGDDRRLKISFGIGLFNKSFPFSSIVSCRITRTPWYFGWGLRAIPGGWLFNVSGFRSVELEMRNGRIYRIGTDEPEKLEFFLKTKLAKS